MDKLKIIKNFEKLTLDVDNQTSVIANELVMVTSSYNEAVGLINDYLDDPALSDLVYSKVLKMALNNKSTP
ncbi:hypothetical protein LOX61_00220 [Latilactobacillus curvatus]|uniref:hypothetical protein n=1 Tax=Latilactobacillus curvatus TaxID=28038 RepID=UPI001C006712|nr:hypothetical protein [Latilactobacillus curvatus]MCP8848932.1 hypothetical protein [Latilactobacillus curvatus]QWF35083.1 hypothetical protein KME73_06230 [Latilactobacillus curvatus]